MDGRELRESPSWHPYKLNPVTPGDPGHTWNGESHQLSFSFLRKLCLRLRYLKGDFFLLMTGWMTALYLPSREKVIQKT